MHAEDEQDAEISKYYGIWPAIFGLLFAAAVIWMMFQLADGFS